MLSEIRKFLNPRNPLFQFAVFLCGFAALSTFDLFAETTEVAEKIIFTKNIILVAGLYIVAYYAARYTFGFTITNPLNVLVSSLLIYLLVHPTNPWWFFVLVFIGVFAGKYFFSLRNQPIFNPTAFGLFFTLYLTKILFALKLAPDSLLISWWGADIRQQFLEKSGALHIVVAVCLLLTFMYFARAFKKLNYALIFFLTYIFCYFGYNLLISHDFLATLRLVSAALFDSTAFLALVMIAEPKTSPVMPRQHFVIGIISGIALFLYVVPLINVVAEPFISTVLTANLFTAVIKQKRLLQ